MNYKKIELAFSAVLFVIGMLLFAHTFNSIYDTIDADMSKGPVFFPRIILVVWMFCCMAIFVNALFSKGKEKAFLWGRVLTGWFFIAIFVFLFDKIGFVFSGILFFLSMAWFMGYRNKIVLICTVLGYIALLFLVFTKGLDFVLPTFPGLGV